MADEKKRIIDYPETNTVGDDDYLLMSQYNETTEQYDSKKVKAVKVGGGGGAILGTSEPTAATGEDTELYYLMQQQAGFNYLRFDTWLDRNNEFWVIEFGGITFANSGGSYFDFTGSTVEVYGFTCTSDGAAENAIDNDSSTFARYNGVGSADYPIQLIINLANPINTNTYNTFGLWNGRDCRYLPKNFSLYGSIDGINWIKLFVVTDDTTVTTQPNQLDYTTTLPTADFSNLITRDYVKYNGAWLPANFNANSLSLKERVVNIVNGEPVYQKTVRLTGFSSSGSASYNFADIGIPTNIQTDSFIFVDAFTRVQAAATGKVTSFALGWLNSEGLTVKIYVDDKILQLTGTNSDRGEAFITIQYRKTAA